MWQQSFSVAAREWYNSLSYTPNEHLHNSIHFLFVLSHQDYFNTHCNLISKLECNNFSRGLEGIKKRNGCDLKNADIQFDVVIERINSYSKCFFYQCGIKEGNRVSFGFIVFLGDTFSFFFFFFYNSIWETFFSTDSLDGKGLKAKILFIFRACDYRPTRSYSRLLPQLCKQRWPDTRASLV